MQNSSGSFSRWIPHFPAAVELERLGDADLPHFYNAQAVFACLSLLGMSIGLALGAFALRHHRYVYKRLTAAVFAVTGQSRLRTVGGSWLSVFQPPPNKYGLGRMLLTVAAWIASNESVYITQILA